MQEIMQSVRTTLQKESEAILEALRKLDEAAVLAVTDAIARCKGNIILSGCGTSGAAARKIAHTFNCIECPALFLEPSDAVHGGLGIVRKGDVIILLSKGGATREINELIAPCKQKGALIIGVTENARSMLAKESDIHLSVVVEAEPDAFNMLATASILAVIAVFDAIVIALTSEKQFSRERFALIHPGGAVGERLLNDKP